LPYQNDVMRKRIWWAARNHKSLLEQKCRYFNHL